MIIGGVRKNEIQSCLDNMCMYSVVGLLKSVKEIKNETFLLVVEKFCQL